MPQWDLATLPAPACCNIRPLVACVRCQCHLTISAVVPKLATPFLLQSLRLSYTPRKFLVHPERKTLVIAEADHASVPAAEREPLPDAFAEVQLCSLSGHTQPRSD